MVKKAIPKSQVTLAQYRVLSTKLNAAIDDYKKQDRLPAKEGGQNYH